MIEAANQPDKKGRAAVPILARLAAGLALAGSFVASGGAEPTGRGFSSSTPQAAGVPATPTVESVSREAQREIRACGDSVAFECVADVLTRYAGSLRQIARERANRPAP